MVQALVIQQLKALAVEKEPSKWWVMRLLRAVGLSYKRPGFDPLAKHSVEQQMDNVQNLKENLDVLTCCMLLPLRQTGWSARGLASGASTGSEKDTTTVTLAHTASGEVFDFCATVLHKGKIAAVLPRQPWQEH
eukprot:4920529-Amphidinium_carterae.1